MTRYIPDKHNSKNVRGVMISINNQKNIEHDEQGNAYREFDWTDNEECPNGKTNNKPKANT